MSKREIYTQQDARITLDSNLKEVLEATESASETALATCGHLGAGYAQINLTENKSVDTGNLRNSMAFQLKDKETVEIGTVVDYARYVELGTSRSIAKPYLKPALSEHTNDYQKVITQILKANVNMSSK